MSTDYVKVGTTAYIYFRSPSTVSAFDTGRISTDFTLDIVKNGTGNQATTGCTFSEVDSTNNPGEYVYACSGSTSFVSATGQYAVTVYRTSDKLRVWTANINVTSDGTGAGTWGDAVFTATASDGRVMSGGSPLEAATVRVVNSAGVVWAQTTTNSSGLWGPIYFNANGTYTVYVQKAGYTTTSGTITVAALVATGPGADLSITQTSTAGTLLASTFLGFIKRTNQDRSSSLADTEAIEILNDAVDMIAMERQWDYYHTRGAVQCRALYETGTLAINNGSTTCTLSSGTWPSWAASGEIFVDGTWVVVESRTSDTVVVLADAWGNDNVTAATYSLVQFRYALPTDCIRISDTLFGNQWPFVGQPTSAAHIEALKDAWQSTNSQPFKWAIEGGFMCFWPVPEENKNVNLLYFRRPTAVASSGDTIDWDSQHPFLLRRAIEYIVALRRKADSDEKLKAIGAAKNAYDEALNKALPWDKTAADPSSASSGMSNVYGPDNWLTGDVDP
jgi:hypothetical protein